MGKKRRTKRKHSPALVPVPGKLAELLNLANLLPVEFRSPFWAQRREFRNSSSPYPIFQSFFQSLVFESLVLHRGASEESREESLWENLLMAIQGLPLALQAFVLFDVVGEMVEVDGRQFPNSIDAATQALSNLQIIGRGELELKKFINWSLSRHEQAVEEDRKYFQLVWRARQRLLFVLATQELLSCLTDGKPEELLSGCHALHLSGALQSRPYVNSEGKLAFTTPDLFRYLDDIEAKRIRECPICYKFFWAGRKDMACCSTQCAQAYRARKWRRRYYEIDGYKNQRHKKAEAKDCESITNRKEKA